MTEIELERFLSHVEHIPGINCHLWAGSMSDGYGMLRQIAAKRSVGAHRLAYEHFKGPVGDMHVLHKCDVRNCVNPDHLFLGTNADNVADKVAKGRQAKGPDHALKGSKVTTSRLREENIPTIRQMLAEGLSQNKIAAKFGVSQTLIGKIKRGLLWVHIP